MSWLLLILSLPTENATARMRAWRALKLCGAAVLRDGVYLLPQRPGQTECLDAIADDVRAHAGSAHLLTTPGAGDDFEALFDRAAEWGALLGEIDAARASLVASTTDGLRQARRLRKRAEQLRTIDFFPGEAQRQGLAALQALEQDAAQALSPHEPRASLVAIERLNAADFQGQLWATRARPWVDRLASAWLIRRWIDPQARFLWLQTPADCPPEALGFDFDGARFSHVGARVTFETLLASFSLQTPALLRLGLLVHGLDAGGVQPPESAGVERVLAGMHAAIADDDQLALATAGVFEGLWTAFEADTKP